MHTTEYNITFEKNEEVQHVLIRKYPTILTLKSKMKGHLGGSAFQCLPWAWGVILESLDRVPHRAPCMEPASPSACVSASLPLSLSLINK